MGDGLGSLRQEFAVWRKRRFDGKVEAPWSQASLGPNISPGKAIFQDDDRNRFRVLPPARGSNENS